MRLVTTYPNGIAACHVTPFPSSPQLAVIHDTFASPRGQGLGWRGHVDRLHELYQLGYDAVVCTVRADNEAQTRILRRAGWTNTGQFHSRQSGNVVLLYFRTLTDLPAIPEES